MTARCFFRGGLFCCVATREPAVRRDVSVLVHGSNALLSLGVPPCSGNDSRMTRLILLALDILDAILDGREPNGLSIDTLALDELPGDWDAQRAKFGFPAAG